MDADSIKALGAVAGIGGLALGVFLVLFRDFLAKLLLPQLGKTQAYRLLRLFLFLVWSIAVLGVAAYVGLELKTKQVVLYRDCPPKQVIKNGITFFDLDPDCSQATSKDKARVVQANIDVFLASTSKIYATNFGWIVPAFEQYKKNPTPEQWKVLREQMKLCDGIGK